MLAINRARLTRNLLFAALVLVLGFSGGLAGALTGAFVAGDGDHAEQPAPAAALAASPAPDESERVRSALRRVLPAVVTVLANLPPEQLPDGRVRQQQNVGSGIVVSAAGHVITNFHVIDGAQTITVVLDTLEERPAILLSDDSPFSDLAVLLVASQGLRVATFGDSAALSRGQPVLAIAGGLFGFEHSVSTGVVSALNRSWPRNGVILEDLVQTDAAVNHGDSGGALINLDGEIIGMLTTVVRSDPSGRTVEGVAFAQSSNALRPAVEAIMATGTYARPRPGIERPGTQHIQLSAAVAAERGLPVPAGALVIAPAPGSPAEAAGIQPGDIVVAVNGVAIDFDNPLPNLLKRLPRGADAEFLIVRGSVQLVITVSPWEE